MESMAFRLIFMVLKEKADDGPPTEAESVTSRTSVEAMVVEVKVVSVGVSPSRTSSLPSLFNCV